MKNTRLTGALLFVLATAYFAALAPYGLNLDDEGTLLYQIYRTYLGQILYDDFHAGYTPGIFYWNAALFWLFDVNVIALRLCLALINGLSVYSMYWLARHLGASALAAAAGGLVYVAIIPYYDGQFAAFNIPYPIWYVTLFWLLSLICTARWWEHGHIRWWVLAGACAGVVFTFKPNSGLLNLAGLLIALGRLQRPEPVAAEGGALWRAVARSERTLRWLIPVVLLIGLTLLFARGAGNGRREVLLFAVPLLVVAGHQLVSQPARTLARPVRTGAIWIDLVWLGIGFALITVPWVAYFWAHLGTRPFLRAVLFIGTDFDRFYYLPYPPLGRWDVGVAVLIGGAWVIGMLLRRRWLRASWLAMAAGAAGVAVVAWLWRHPPPMVEGFQASVVTRMRSLGFSVILLTEWLAIAAYVLRAREGVRAENGVGELSAARKQAGVLGIVALSAVLMHMQLYPRTDFMHLVPACPGVLVLGAWLLSRLAEMWQGGARNPWGGALTRAAVVAPLYLLAAIFVAPAVFRTWYLMRAWWERDTTAVVRLENGRAPLVIEPAAGATFRALSDTARYLREHATADEFVFTFPALDVISFLADRQNPTRHGYFYPGWPGHEVEAEVIDALRARPPRFIVALHGHALFFVTAPVYYFNLRDYVTDQYRLVERIGVFDVLGPNGADANDAKADDASASLADTLALWRAELQHDGRPMARRLEAALATLPAATPAALASALAQLDPAAQRLAALLVRKSRSAIGAAALATLLADRTLAPLVRALCLRVIGEVGELQSVVPLLAALKGAELNELGGLFGDLFTVTSRSWVEGYWFAPSDRYEFEEIGAHIQDRQLLQWIDDPWELGAVRAFAIRLAGRLGDRTMIPFLLRVVGDPNESIFLRTDAAHSLAELDYGAEALPAIGRLLQNDALVPAVLVARLYPKAPRAGRAVLLDAIRSRSDTVRATAYWIAAAVDDPTLIDALQRGLSDPFPEVQMAAAWGLGNLRAASSLAALAALADGANDQVARFAAQAMEKAKGP